MLFHDNYKIIIISYNNTNIKAVVTNVNCMNICSRSHDRTAEDLETIYEELLHLKPLSHLTNSIKRELASVIVFEAHSKAGTVRKCNICLYMLS